MVNKNSSCCSNDCSCSQKDELKPLKRQIIIDFLYLDLNVCNRCQGTDSILDEALKDVENILVSTGINVLLNKINVNSEVLAITHKFISSPTIRINGKDIQMDIKESNCESCRDLCGEEVDCRIWTYLGNEYSTPPKGMIIDAILREVYGSSKKKYLQKKYVLPKNLKQFYIAMNNKKNLEEE